MLVKKLWHEGEDYYLASDVDAGLLNAAKRALELERGCPLTVIPSGTLESLLKEVRDGERERCVAYCELVASECHNTILGAFVSWIASGIRSMD